MKTSKRNLARLASLAERKTTTPPKVSKYAAKQARAPQ